MARRRKVLLPGDIISFRTRNKGDEDILAVANQTPDLNRWIREALKAWVDTKGQHSVTEPGPQNQLTLEPDVKETKEPAPTAGANYSEFLGSLGEL